MFVLDHISPRLLCVFFLNVAPFTEWDFAPADASINISVSMYDKTPTRLLEGLFLRFNVSSAAETAYSVDKLGSWVNPFDVQPGGNQHHHGTWSGVQALRSSTNSSLIIGAPDASVSCFGAPTVFPAPTNASSDPLEGASFVLMDQLWNTNCESILLQELCFEVKHETFYELFELAVLLHWH